MNYLFLFEMVCKGSVNVIEHTTHPDQDVTRLDIKISDMSNISAMASSIVSMLWI
jgi:hypothetical protein